MSVPPRPKIHDWVPPVIVDAAKDLQTKLCLTGGTRHRLVLYRLIEDPQMRLVWNELYKRKRGKAGQYLHPGLMTYASHAASLRRRAIELRQNGGDANEREAMIFEFEATALLKRAEPMSESGLSEQDRAVKLFFIRALQSAMDIKPVSVADVHKELNQLRSVTETQHEQVRILRSLGMKESAHDLELIAEDSDNEVFSREASLDPENDPWIIRRNRGDPNLRTFLVSLSIITTQVFEKQLYGTLATVANVVFNRQVVTPRKVREMLRFDPGE